MTSPFDICRQLDGIAKRDGSAPVILACRRAAQALRAGREGAQTAVLAELQQLTVAESARPAVQSVMRWASGQTAYQNRALHVPQY